MRCFWEQTGASVRSYHSLRQGLNDSEIARQMVKRGADTWRLWLGLGLGRLNAVRAFSIARNVMPIFLAVSVLIALVGLIQFSLWSKLRRSWL